MKTSLVVFAFILSACDAMSPEFARRIAPLPAWYAWTQEVERCAGRAISFGAVEWYVVDGPDPFFSWEGHPVSGLHTKTPGEPHRIYLTEWHVYGLGVGSGNYAEWIERQRGAVAHEYLHALGFGGAPHPQPPFGTRAQVGAGTACAPLNN